MKVLVIGGAGGFGVRLAELLLRDGHQVTIGGRSRARAEAAAARLGAAVLVLDRAGDLAGLAGFEVLIDAAGPFHSYADPLRLPRACLSAGAHYLDLSDNAAFTERIAGLDAEAKAVGLFALSGVSSVLGLPMPRALLPGSEGFEAVEDGRFRFDVTLKAPLTGRMVVRYAGSLARAVPEVPAEAPRRPVGHPGPNLRQSRTRRRRWTPAC